MSNVLDRSSKPDSFQPCYWLQELLRNAARNGIDQSYFKTSKLFSCARGLINITSLLCEFALSLDNAQAQLMKEIVKKSASLRIHSVQVEAASTNMVDIDNMFPVLENLEKEWMMKPRNLKKCGETLDQLKLALTHLEFLPTSSEDASIRKLHFARDILEIGVQWSIESKDIPSFERYMAQLKCYYFDYIGPPESAYKYQLLGLNLLFLLSQNRVAEFHTELERLPSDKIQSNVYIRHSLSLEQCLMEGSYNKIFLAKGNVPAESYNFFIDILLNTVRDEIGACMESAYDKVSLKDASRMLNLSSEKETMAFATKKNWTLEKDGNFYFTAQNEKKSEDPIPSSDLATLAIDYARELEMIV